MTAGATHDHSRLLRRRCGTALRRPAIAARIVEDAFGVTAAGSSVGAELRGGLTTFATMAYIVVVNASLLSQAGLPFDAVVFATCAAAALGSLFMALWANYPFALAPGMGMNAYFAFSVVPAVAGTLGPDADPDRAWRVALGLAGWSGVLFLLATWLEIRGRVMRAIPGALKLAVSAGIGLFIAFIGLQSAGIVVADPVTLVQLGDVRTATVAVALAGLAITGGLWVRGLPGALLGGIVVTTVLAILAGLATAPAGWMALPTVMPTFLRWDLLGALDVRFVDVLIALLFVDFFDTMGTLVGVGVQGGFMDDEGNLPRDGRALSADAAATVAGAALGTSPVTTYIESASGIAAGARTGLANLVVVAGFCGAMFFAPLLGAVPPLATAPALVIVGALMATGLGKVDWDDHADGLAAFVTALGIPATFSISDGLALGITTYIGAKALGGRAGEISAVMWGLGAVFLLRYALLPVA